jgi:hypothetical protein
MQRTHLLAIVGGTALTFVILFILQYRQEKRLKEFRIRHSQLEMRVLELEQSTSLMAASIPIQSTHQSSSSRSRAKKKMSFDTVQPVQSVENGSINDEVIYTPNDNNKSVEMSEDMRREIEYMEHELDTMERILENDASKMLLINMVNKYADNTFVDLSKVSNVSDDDADMEDTEETVSANDADVEEEYESEDSDDIPSSQDGHSEHDSRDDIPSEHLDDVNDTTSIMVVKHSPVVQEANGSHIDIDDLENEDICSSEMEIIIQSTQNDIATQATNESHYIVSSSDDDEIDSDNDDDVELKDIESRIEHTEVTATETVKQETSVSTRMTKKEIEHLMNQYKVNELKDLCRREGLSQVGLKRELVERLMAKGVHFNSASASA